MCVPQRTNDAHHHISDILSVDSTDVYIDIDTAATPVVSGADVARGEGGHLNLSLDLQKARGNDSVSYSAVEPDSLIALRPPGKGRARAARAFRTGGTP